MRWRAWGYSFWPWDLNSNGHFTNPPRFYCKTHTSRWYTFLLSLNRFYRRLGLEWKWVDISNSANLSGWSNKLFLWKWYYFWLLFLNRSLRLRLWGRLHWVKQILDFYFIQFIGISFDRFPFIQDSYYVLVIQEWRNLSFLIFSHKCDVR